MDKQKLIARLFEMPAKIEQAETEVIKANQELTEARNALQNKENSLIIGGEIQGKNETQRKAELKTLTEYEQEAVAEKEIKLSNARAELNKMQNEFSSLRSIAQLLSAEHANAVGLN